ncbi:MAG: PEP-CTERM sorting domain-containing protein [Planctomycetota bacterium]
MMFAAALSLAAGATQAQTFFYVGPDSGDFFTLANWNTAADGTGSAPAAGSLPDASVGDIALDLIIDGRSVLAAGEVDFGTGSLGLSNAASLEITGAGNDVDFSADATLTVTGASLAADGDVVFRGNTNLLNATITASTDDVEFQDTAIVSVVNSNLTAGDNLFFDAFNGSITGSNLVSSDRLGLRGPGGSTTAVVVTDTNITVNAGLGDVDDVFDFGQGDASLTLLGDSTLLADAIEETVDLILGDRSTATLGGNGNRIVNDGSTVTVASFDARLIVGSAINFDPRDDVVNGLTGLSYLDDPTAWTVSDWNGLDAITLQLIPEPTSLALLGLGGLVVLRRRR